MRRITFLYGLGLFALLIAICSAGCVTPTEEPIAQPNNFTVSLVMEKDNKDVPFATHVENSLSLLENESGVTIIKYINETHTDAVSSLKSLKETKPDLIVTGGFKLESDVLEFAKANPNMNILTIDYDFSNRTQPNNVANILFRSNEASYVAGYVAGMTTKTNTLGFVGITDNDVVQKFYDGFAKGVEKAATERGVEITIIENSVSSFNKPDDGYAIGTQMYKDGVDIIYPPAGESGLGVIRAAKERNAYVIGVDGDQRYLAPECVIFNVVIDIPLAVKGVALKYLEGKSFGGQTISLGYMDGKYVGVTDYLDGVVSREVIEKAKDIEAELEKGSLVKLIETETANGNISIKS